MAPIQVMSFNLRCLIAGTPPDSPDSWTVRQPALVALIDALAPDVVGTQEGMFDTLTPLLARLPAYRLVGMGRDGGSDSEYTAIMYRADRLELTHWQQFWLSPTPELIGSRGWDTAFPRTATIASFRDLADGAEFSLANTHLDHVSERARVEGARLIASRLPAGPALVTGDFNCDAGAAEAYGVLLDAGLRDTWDEVAERTTPLVDSFHGYAEPAASDPCSRIDWIMASAEWTVQDAAIVTERPGGVWPSDHWPVTATVELRRPPR